MGNAIVFRHMKTEDFLFICVFRFFQQYFITLSVPVSYFLKLSQVSLLLGFLGCFFGAPGEEHAHRLWLSLLLFLLLL